jgi:hypothetical protein
VGVDAMMLFMLRSFLEVSGSYFSVAWKGMRRRGKNLKWWQRIRWAPTFGAFALFGSIIWGGWEQCLLQSWKDRTEIFISVINPDEQKMFNERVKSAKVNLNVFNTTIREADIFDENGSEVNQ